MEAPWRSSEPQGQNVLVLERGGAMALEDQNVADVDLFRKDRYHPKTNAGLALTATLPPDQLCPWRQHQDLGRGAGAHA